MFLIGVRKVDSKHLVDEYWPLFLLSHPASSPKLIKAPLVAVKGTIGIGGKSNV